MKDMHVCCNMLQILLLGQCQSNDVDYNIHLDGIHASLSMTSENIILSFICQEISILYYTTL